MENRVGGQIAATNYGNVCPRSSVKALLGSTRGYHIIPPFLGSPAIRDKERRISGSGAATVTFRLSPEASPPCKRPQVCRDADLSQRWDGRAIVNRALGRNEGGR